MSDFGFNTDNQVTSVMSLTNPVYDGSGNPTAFSSPASTPSSLQFGGSAPYDAASASFAFDSENRLVGISSSSPSPAVSFSALYDGAGVREIKTTAADGTVYFLLDASGAPVVEETYTGTTASFGTISAFGPDGLRSRYTVSDNSETAFFYDPQGTLVNRISSVDSGVAVNGEPMTDVSVWDGYGQQRSDQWTNRTIDQQYTPNDPVGFEGQAGYYADWELAQTSNPASYVYLRSVPSLLTHRYYDASTGRFVNRDPIGYGGGMNLYGYCGGNPINKKDPNGTDLLDDTANFSAGAGDVLSFGTTHWGRLLVGRLAGVGDANASVNLHSGTYHGGQVAGTVIALAQGVGGFIKAAPALIKAAGAAPALGEIIPRVGGIIYKDLAPDIAGETDWTGNITINRNLSPQQMAATIDHELVHRFFTGSSVLAGQVKYVIYSGSDVARFLEEATAETVGSRNLLKGLTEPFKPIYQLTVSGVVGKGVGLVQSSYGLVKSTH